MTKLFYDRYYKGVKSCPFCGGKSYFGVVSGGSWGCQCEECNVVGKVIQLPNYYNKGGERLWSRMFRRSLKHWNKRSL